VRQRSQRDVQGVRLRSHDADVLVYDTAAHPKRCDRGGQDGRQPEVVALGRTQPASGSDAATGGIPAARPAIAGRGISNGSHIAYNQTAAGVVPQVQDEALQAQHMPAGLDSGAIGFAADDSVDPGDGDANEDAEDAARQFLKTFYADVAVDGVEVNLPIPHTNTFTNELVCLPTNKCIANLGGQDFSP